MNKIRTYIFERAMVNVMKIRHLRRDGMKWSWDVQVEPDDWEYCYEHYDHDYNENYKSDEFPNMITFCTNQYGEGLWKEVQHGWDLIYDCPWTEMDQIEGTCQYDMSGCHTKSGAYTHIRRYFKPYEM